MAIPTHRDIMLPLLKLMGDGTERTLHQCQDILTDQFHLTAEERERRLSSGRRVFDDRVSWACTYLKKAALLQSTGKGIIQITSRGLQVLSNSPDRITTEYLMQFEEFREFVDRSRRPSKKGQTEETESPSEETPEEMIESAYARHLESLSDGLLEQVMAMPPAFFEHLVTRLLLAMGYGKGLTTAGSVTGGSGDEGIDGIINEDKLGLDVIYIQAKRWTNPVGRPEIQRFVGALHGKHAQKGVFITTSTFSQEARDYVKTLNLKVVLVDGKTLARLMVDYNVGVSAKATYVLKSIDRDFFEGPE
ncbi:MAG TPA: restriction endonuclease [Candidatus Hydrogenedentes bacterium]|nr:restriction endonuclease [Candidatus Hydrogenedentota bacterium]